MADPAVFKKPKARSSRQRAASPSNDAIGEDSSETTSASILAAKVRKQQKERLKPKPRLSFGGDEVRLCFIV
jgi:GC-rich sequence DNA-binding factor